ncbi:zinc ribbon domain-containing protein [uncultured Draconibacterium sp.]|uniref:zinc ribbon domain-containing protein n=1 Tax=uncultured Draconibacterium sp. TaxID=1573823 RepID=UPI0032177206
MSTNKCPKCHNMVSVTDKFCPVCGAPLHKISSDVVSCKSCNHQNKQGAAFCEKCGNSLGELNTEAQNKIPSENAHKIVSKGNYSGTMVKGKTSRGWKIFRNLIVVLVLLAVVALIVWFQVDPDAGTKLKDAAMGTAFMAVFFFVGWLFMRGKKGNKYDWDDDQYADVADDDD